MKTYNINEALEWVLDPQESLFTWDELYIVKLICRNSVISNDEISVDKIKFLCSNFRIDKSGELLYTDMGVSRLKIAFNEDFAKVDEQSVKTINGLFPFKNYGHWKQY